MSELKEPEIEGRAIYTRWAVIGFCVFFSPLFGGFLLRQNLKENGQPKAGAIVLLISLGMVLVSALVLQTKFAGPGVSFALNLIQGGLLTEYVFRKYFPDADQRPAKSLQRAFLISLLFVLLALLLLIFQGGGLAQ